MIKTGSVAFLLGIIIFCQLTTLPSLWHLLHLPLVLLALFILLKLNLSATHRHAYLFICVLICGFLWALLRAAIILNDGIHPAALQGDTVLTEGYIKALPTVHPNSVRFEFQAKEIRSKDGLELAPSSKLRLSWYSNDVDLKPGQCWQLHIRLKQPYGFSNPGTFDYEAWLFRHRIRATGYVINKADNRLLTCASNNLPITTINRLRHSLRTMINQTNIDSLQRSLIIALSLGDRSQILPATNQILRQTGTSHLLAISGLHISLIAGIFFIIGRWLWAFSICLPRYLPCQYFAIATSLLAAIAYAALAGFSIPTQRALTMLLICLLALLCHRKFAYSDIIATALMSVLFIDPFAVMDIGFSLSFSAVSAITYGISCRVQNNPPATQKTWLKWGKAQYVVAIALLPMLIVYTNQYPLFSIIVNTIAIPYISLFVLPLILIGIILLSLASPLAEFVLYLASQLLLHLWSLLQYFSTISINTWDFPTPSLPAFIAALIGIISILAPRGIFPFWLGYYWLLPLLLSYKPMPQPGDFWLTQLDVGQGLATVVQTHNHVLIYDAGDAFSPRFNAGQMVVIPFLKRQNITRPDLLLASHSDRDHIGGMQSILHEYPNIHLLTNATDKLTHSHLQPCIAGTQWHWDGIHFEILSPDQPNLARSNDNNSSCVLKISNALHSVLLTGDIEQLTENRLIRMMPEKLPATLLIAPHHGSKTSSSPDFIAAVAPQFVIFSVGYRNRFRLPKQAIIDRYQAHNSIIFNTARDGAITFRFTNNRLAITRHRHENQRFWHNNY